MLYPIPAKLTLDGFSTKSNNVLSSVDKAFIRSMYPQLENFAHGVDGRWVCWLEGWCLSLIAIYVGLYL